MGETDLAFVLRGRPGLGHIMPGLALAVQAASDGRRVTIATYDKGYEYLARSALPDALELYRLDCGGPYRDWPGLDLYDHGLRDISPLIERIKPRVCVLGGEYMMAPLSAILPCKTALMFNPDIFEQQEKNLAPSTLFLQLFGAVDYLVPMTPFSFSRQYMAKLADVRHKVTVPGPFLYQPAVTAGCDSDGRPIRVVIANGGGVAFPSSTASYSSSAANPINWLQQTKDMTRKAIEAVLGRAEQRVTIDVFSCLGESDNAELAKVYASNHVVRVQAVSLAFYAALRCADVVISRAGAGFIADVATTGASVAVWPLQGHDEQLNNAKEFALRRERVRVCVEESGLTAAIADLLEDPALGQHRVIRTDAQNKARISALLSELLK